MLSDKTIQELSHRSDVLSGEIAIGCGESRNMSFLAEQMKSFNKLYPQVKFSIYSATTDDIKDRIEKGLLDMGLLMEPVNIGRYEFIHMPLREKWAILTRRDSELGNKLVIKPEDLHVVPLSPALETGAVLAWKRNQTHSSATSYFIKHIKNNLDI